MYAVERISKGTIVYAFKGTECDKPNMHTVQVGEGKHVDLGNCGSRFTNHSCNPSTRLDWETYDLIATRDIEVGDEITFNYITSEFAMDAPFECGCSSGVTTCYKTIRGAKYLSKSDFETLKPFLAPYCIKMYNEQV